MAIKIETMSEWALKDVTQRLKVASGLEASGEYQTGIDDEVDALAREHGSVQAALEAASERLNELTGGA